MCDDWNSLSMFAVVRNAHLPAAIVAVLAGVAPSCPRFLRCSPHATQEAIAERFLWTVLVLYWVSLVPAVVGGAILTISWSGPGATGSSDRWRPACCLLCASTLLSVVMIETGSAVWLAWAHRFPNLPTRFRRLAGRRASCRGDRWVECPGPALPGLALDRPDRCLEAPGRRLPDRRVVADVLAREGAMLEEMHQKLAGIKHRPDVLIVFSGHNEFQARFPWDQDGDRPGGLLPYALEFVMQDGLHSPSVSLC